MVWLAIAGAAIACIVAIGCAIAAAWMSHPKQPVVSSAQIVPSLPQPTIVVQMPQPLVPATFVQQSSDTSDPIVLTGNYPRLGNALGAWLQSEQDPIERTRIARDLGTVGGADAARSLLDGVRSGAISPTVAADHLARGGFEAGIAVAAALRDPEPRVRALANAIVSRCTPVEPLELPSVVSRPMPQVPRPPREGN